MRENHPRVRRHGSPPTPRSRRPDADSTGQPPSPVRTGRPPAPTERRRGGRRRDGGPDEGDSVPVAALLGDADLVVVSNREPYVHSHEDGAVTVDRPVGGLTAALDPAMQAAGGTWIAWASGDADDAVTDDDGCVAVPPEDPSYTLKRVPLSDADVDDYYYGFSNRVLWPICHYQVEKLDCRPGYWDAYRRVNRRFADAVVDQVGDARDAVVWFQDYHLGLAPRLVRDRLGPAPSLAQFWHTPWPAAGTFAACPYGQDLLDGLLANDLLGFHLDRYCEHFLDAVERALDATVDRSTGTVTYRGHRTRVRAFPLGADFDAMDANARSQDGIEGWQERAADMGVDPGVRLAVGVDRLDYSKGLVGRLAALEAFWERNPEWRGRLTYVQKGSESRGEIPEYARVQEQVETAVERINDRFGTDDWTPVVYCTDTLSRETLAGLYRDADVALVTPVCDGMNLVAKEYVAASVDGTGSLVLSEGAGASDELGGPAVSVPSGDVGELADAIGRALEMPVTEQRRRMTELRRRVAAADPNDWMTAQLRAALDNREDAEPVASPVR